MSPRVPISKLAGSSIQRLPFSALEQIGSFLSSVEAAGNLIVDKANTITLVTSARKEFRNGLTLSPDIQLSRTVDHLVFPQGYNTASAGINLNWSLLRGGGRSSVDAEEQQTRQELGATELDLRNEAAQLIENVVVSYWQLKTASEHVKVAEEAEERGRLYVASTQTLVDADQVPRNDLNEVSANLAQLSALAANARATEGLAQSRLAADLGLSERDVATATFQTIDAFPSNSANNLVFGAADVLSPLYQRSLSTRADYLAVQTRLREQQIGLKAAQNLLLPQLDAQSMNLYSRVNMGSSAASFFSADAGQTLGPNLNSSLVLSHPIRNDYGWGSVKVTSANVEMSRTNLVILQRTIAQQIRDALTSLRDGAVRQTYAQTAVLAYRSSLTGAQEKYRAGFGSIVEILTIQDRLTGVQNTLIDADLELSTAIVQLRYATGTLVPVSGAIPTVLNPKAVVTLPVP